MLTYRTYEALPRRLEMGGRPSIPRSGGVEETGGEAAGECAVEAASTVLVGDDLVLEREWLLPGDGVGLELGQRRPEGSVRVLRLLVHDENVDVGDIDLRLKS